MDKTNKFEREIMNKGIGIALLVAGIVLVIFGCNGYESVSSGVSRTFTGTPYRKNARFVVRRRGGHDYRRIYGSSAGHEKSDYKF